MKVVTSTQAWEGFVRRAKRAFPNEYIEALWGEETVDSYRITDFKKVKITKQSAKAVEYDDAEIKRQKWLAQKYNKIFLGTIHTHPRADLDTAPSAQDHNDGFKDSEKIMGVVVIYKNKDNDRFVVEVAWWIPQKMEFVLLPE